MLHRLSLRVLPALTLAVTDETVRKRKRLVMLAPGLVAFGVYRLIKLVNPLADPATLLCVSGFLAALTALAAYRVGRRIGFAEIWRVDGAQRLAWVGGWIGVMYGIQLSLLVLTLLRIVIQYDFLLHPDGPAMMAIIIACTSVARDAFEIGHVRLLQASGRPLLTFPDGKSLRQLVRQEPAMVIQWATVGGTVCAGVASVLSALVRGGAGNLSQLAGVTLVGGTVALWSYLGGVQQTRTPAVRWNTLGWNDLFRFWWWPGLAFSATYYLVLAGVFTFLMRMEYQNPFIDVVLAASVGALMASYGYYLGDRRYREDRVDQKVPASLLRCPFVMGILSRGSGGSVPASLTPVGVALEKSGQQT